MKLVGFSQAQPARLLADYLNEQGIRCRWEPHQGEHQIVLQRADQYAAAHAIVEEFKANPNAAKFAAAAWQNAEGVSINWRKAEQRGIWLQTLKQSPLTSAVLVSCLLVFVLAVFGIAPQIYPALRFESMAVLMESGQWYRLIGPAFLHFSVLHLVFNLLWWWILGRQIEARLGTLALLLIFLAIAIVSNLAQFWVSGNRFGGLSGVVYGVMGVVWWTGWLRPHWGLELPRAIVGFMLVWLVVGYLDILGVPMANTAHTVGLITGCALAFIWTRFAGRPQSP